MDLAKIYSDLERDEGIRFVVYHDSVGVPTVGVGHNLLVPLSLKAVRAILEDDVNAAISLLDDSIGWWRDQPPQIQEVMVEMAFNLGNRLLQFRQTLSHLLNHRYPEAAKSMLQSKWAKQVGDRAKRLAAIVRSVV